MNSQYFSKKQIESGEFQKFLEVLMSQAYGKGEIYNDIRIFPADCEAFIVEWAQVPWDHSYGGEFKYVDEDQEVMIQEVLPDGHYEYFHDNEEYNEYLKQWLIDNPGWERNEFTNGWHKKDE